MPLSSDTIRTSKTLDRQLAHALGARRSARLRGVMRQTRLPAEVLLDLAIELIDIASRKLAGSPLQRTAVALGAARWRNVGAAERSRIARRAVEARWAKHRASQKHRNKSRDE